MKFLLHKGLGYSSIHRIGDYLRSHGAGRHWIERYRGDVFLVVLDEVDEAILGKEFSELLDAVNETEGDGTRGR
ncbi:MULTISPECIES: hypothetical protein [unclassified Mesorhizobium]|uniref:hypothetical protein n=1 Tax=unclassified Mesorhizobium TaxID=325217 RepID=UPI0007EDE3AA|nr:MULTISPECIES: hypothetical protein [unclassified Mesorhizobium]RUZ92007.1 hypothetical protein EN947_02295 [Mesorhizobium sp. M7A.F.Ca.US.003.02.2.1]RVA51939.1 hypothetical protein EN933_15895 [Mesorhizobium sp. M7A.F.Ca.US.001.01.1.1]ARP65588.1 hypothetical protein A9K65_021200 [Mesorhizobium sp. WSM1497]MBZ9889115.1 hypothetical protein [Mesorhizobium sp. BR1-1-3]RUY25279.1 hypothetical protein EN979_23400 [Mesorhizobium sp. M7A.F.Ca.US.001.04.2.1]